MKYKFWSLLAISIIAIVGFVILINWLTGRDVESQKEKSKFVTSYFDFPSDIEINSTDSIWISLKNNTDTILKNVHVNFEFTNLIPIKSSMLNFDSLLPNEQVSSIMYFKHLVYQSASDSNTDTLNNNQATFRFLINYDGQDIPIGSKPTLINITKPEINRLKITTAYAGLITLIVALIQSILNLNIRKKIYNRVKSIREHYSTSEEFTFNWEDFHTNKGKWKRTLKKQLADKLKESWIERARVKPNKGIKKLTISDNTNWLTIIEFKENNSRYLRIENSKSEIYIAELTNDNKVKNLDLKQENKTQPNSKS